MVGRSPASWEMVAHPTVMRVCHAVLGKQLLHMTEEELAESFTRGSSAKNQVYSPHTLVKPVAILLVLCCQGLLFTLLGFRHGGFNAMYTRPSSSSQATNHNRSTKICRGSGIGRTRSSLNSPRCGHWTTLPLRTGVREWCVGHV